jgi:LytR cell envelope-related transcriptional attenuator
MGVLTLAGAALAVAGLSTVRNSTAGRYERVVGPDEPGYQAHVVPTPTMGVLARAADGTLAGVSLLALEPGDDGGAVIIVPASTIVDGAAGPPGSGDVTLADVYAQDGAAAAAGALGSVVTAAVVEHVEVDDAQWAQLVDPVGPVDVVVDEAVGNWRAGNVRLEPDEVGAFLSILGEGESDLARIERQQSFWNAWLPLVAEGGDDALPGEIGTGIGRFVRGIAGGDGSAAELPVTRVDGESAAGREGGGDTVRFRADSASLGDFVARTVPYPTGAAPDARIRVRLLNGTSDDALTSLAARELVAAGAEIVIAGNASSFDVQTTRFVPAGDPSLAEQLQENLGGGRVEEAASGQDDRAGGEDEIDVTVILGQDAGELIER